MVKRNRRNGVKKRGGMKGGAVELNETEVNNTGCSSTSECNAAHIEKQENNANEQINMRNQMGGSQKVTAQVVAGSSDEEVDMQQQVQKTAYQGQAQAEFDKNAGTVAPSGGRRRKRRKSKKRRKGTRRKSKKRRKRTKGRKSKKRRKRTKGRKSKKRR
jgi:hypothetical protein